ncbi:MAG TPA: phosphopantetheine-binding protein, partial [Chitinophagaceae bacterium]|nr:phosphopantetheine-binding protein [Chitinophagaceae bacterium]
MRNNLPNKTQLYRTGKDIIKLLNEKKDVSKQAGPFPTSEAELKVCVIWENILGYNGFSVKDDFFQIGGNSIKAVQLVARISRHFGVNISLTDVFIHTTIEQQAAHILVQEKRLLPFFKEPQFRPEPLPLSFNQERLWFIDQLEGSVQYHTPSVLRLRGVLNQGALTAA